MGGEYFFSWIAIRKFIIESQDQIGNSPLPRAFTLLFFRECFNSVEKAMNANDDEHNWKRLWWKFIWFVRMHKCIYWSLEWFEKLYLSRFLFLFVYDEILTPTFALLILYCGNTVYRVLEVTPQISMQFQFICNFLSNNLIYHIDLYIYEFWLTVYLNDS